MDLNKLKSFYTVARLKSFSRAAEVLYLTQPAVSTQIKDLEYEYKTKLFDRVGNRIQLTPSGEKLIPYVKSILDIYEDSHFAVNSLKKAGEGSIKLGVSGLPGTILLPAMISSFKKDFPDVVFTIKEQKSAAIIQSVTQNHFDLGIIVNSERCIEKKDLEEKVFYKDAIVIGVSKNNPLKNKKTIGIKEISELPLIVSQKDTVSRKALEKYFMQQSAPFNIAYEIENKSMIKEMVKKDLGIGFFSLLEIKKEIEAESIHALKFENTPFHLYIQILFNKNRELSPASQNFYNFIFDSKKQKRFL